MVKMLCMGDVALHNRLPVLWQQIEDAHYSYLEIDDSPEKLQQKKKLQGYITEYLSLVPNECKFGLPETARVFRRTVNELADYSAYRAGIGWAALARYAANLLAQPWRKEFRLVRLYCGFYKHEVEANLAGAEALMLAMGYRPVGGGRLALDGPVCPDMAAAVSRDALIAQCECQIMASIWEGVWGGGGRVSWAAVAAERLSPSGGLSPDDAYCNVAAPCRCPDAFPPPCAFRPYAPPPPVYVPPARPPVARSPPRRRSEPAVLTARLIEYDSEKEERRRRRAGPSRPGSDAAEPRPALRAEDDGTGTFESWDYVFRNLSRDDRDGGFSQSDRSRTTDGLDGRPRPSPAGLADGLRALELDRERERERRDRPKPKLEEKRAKNVERVGNPVADGLVAAKEAPDKVRLLSKKEVRERKDAMKASEAKGEGWQCATCTFVNARGGACAMCGKSRGAPPPAALAWGGRECPACTLVNGRDAALCDACGTGLEHCPTYV